MGTTLIVRKKVDEYSFDISLKYLHGVVVPKSNSGVENKQLAAMINMEFNRLGFTMTQKLFNRVCRLPEDEMTHLHEAVIELAKLKGADVSYRPMYPNFPKQVMEASLFELYFNAILHYWSFGQWSPSYNKEIREWGLETVNFKSIDVVSKRQFDSIFEDLIYSNESLSDSGKSTVLWFLKNRRNLKYTKTIPYKENLCLISSYLVSLNKDISHLVTNSTDVLRIATYLSSGDISLAKNCHFASFPRKIRRLLVSALAKVIKAEDIARHRGKWIRLFHSLHIGEYVSGKVEDIVQLARSNNLIPTFNGQVEIFIEQEKVREAVNLLKSRPSEFSRRLDHLYRISVKNLKNKDRLNLVFKSFLEVISEVPTRVLIQLMGHFQRRGEDIEKRIVFPKGNTQKSQIIYGHLEKISKRNIQFLLDGISDELKKRFVELEPLGKVWIDESLKDCPVPTQQRSSSKALMQVARGTCFQLPKDKDTIRFFIYWIGEDIDLSVTFHNKNFTQLGNVSYFNLKDDILNFCHSGDITYAPNGASEFVDINIPSLIKNNIHYVMMNVYVYNGPNFSEHEKVYAGWMTRSKPRSNEIYDPKTVDQKIDITSETRNSIPVVIDLIERKVIWTDISFKGNSWINNVLVNKEKSELIMDSIISMDHKLSLYDLFSLHAESRGELVESREEADFVFGWDGDISPYDIMKINKDFVV
jgi:hypothetical protein